MSSYKVSVIIPLFNNEKTIKRAVTSVIRQTLGFDNIELIMVDDCSDDQSFFVAKEMQREYPNIMVFQTGKNSGSAGAGRNVGLSMASAPYVMFLDGDDEYLPEACEVMLNEIESNGDDFVQGPYYQVNYNGERVLVKKDKKDTLYERYLPLVWDKIYNKSFLNRHDIRFSEGYFAEDEAFAALCVAVSKKYHIIDTPIITYHSDEISVSNTVRNEFWRRNIYGSYRYMLEEALRLGVEKEVDDIFRETGLFALYASNICGIDDYDKAKEIIEEWIPVFSYVYERGYNIETTEAKALFPLAAQDNKAKYIEAFTALWRIKRGHIFDVVATPANNYVLCAQGSCSKWLEEIDSRFTATNADAIIMGQFPVVSMGKTDINRFMCDFPPNGSVAVTAETYKAIGEVDASLGWAATTDYYMRIKANGFKVVCAYDLLSPSYEQLPSDITMLWLDSLLLDYKHGDASIRMKTLMALFKSIARYNPSIGNYSRKIIVDNIQHFLSSVYRYRKRDKTENQIRASADFIHSFMARGSFVNTNAENSKQPLVSVVIRTCSRPSVLRRTLESMRFQTYPNYEIVLIEDGVASAKKMVEEEFDDLPISYVATEKHVGRSAAANLGFSLARGAYINLLDDDDYFFPNHLSLAVSAAASRDCDLVFLQSLSLSIQKKSIDPYQFDIIESHFMNFPRIDPFTMSSYCRTPDNGVLFKKEVLSYAIGMREDLDANEDWSLWLRIMTKAKWCVVPYATSCFVVPFSQKERDERMKAYSQYTGLQFEDDIIEFNTPAELLMQYYIGVQNDFKALEAVSQLKESLEYDLKYWNINDPNDYLCFAVEMRKRIQDGKANYYSAKTFNNYYLGLVCEKYLSIK